MIFTCVFSYAILSCSVQVKEGKWVFRNYRALKSLVINVSVISFCIYILYCFDDLLETNRLVVYYSNQFIRELEGTAVVSDSLACPQVERPSDMEVNCEYIM